MSWRARHLIKPSAGITPHRHPGVTIFFRAPVPDTGGIWNFVTSMAAPLAYGPGGCRVEPAPVEVRCISAR
jgi:hypothetical protein